MKSLCYLLVVGCLPLLVACGQKGDLYFPDEEKDVSASRIGEVLPVNYGLL